MNTNNNVYDIETPGFNSPFVSMQSPCGSMESYARTQLVKDVITVPVGLIDPDILIPLNKGITLYLGRAGLLTTKPSLHDFGVVIDIADECVEIDCKLPRDKL